MLQYLGQNPETDGMLWVDPDDVVDMATPTINDSQLKYWIHGWRKKTSTPLFRKKKLEITDIDQQNVGDCWYLSALIAIANHPNGSDLIKKSMVDCHDGNVIVRFFDGDYMPVYIRVEKSIFWNLGPKTYHAGLSKNTGLWPLMLEKAASCMTKSSGRKVCDPEHPNWANLQGGDPDAAFRMLLGCKVSQSLCAGRNLVGANNSGQHLKNLFDQKWYGGALMIQQRHRDALQAVFGGSVSVERWTLEFKKLIDQGSPLVTGDFMVGKKAYRRNFDQLMQAHTLTKLDQGFSMQLLNYARTNHIYSHKMGTGVYSQGALGLFNEIKLNVTNSWPICWQTKQGIGSPTGQGLNPSESKVSGMVQHHAYAILNILEENVMQRRKFVKVANPWGHYGRKYDESPSSMNLSPQEQECGVSWIELTDFCDMVMAIYKCDQNPGDILQFM